MPKSRPESRPESRKVAEYRNTLQRAAKTGRRAGTAGQADLEGKAAKLSLEIQAEESKAAPHKRLHQTTLTIKESAMPRGDKTKYTAKQKRQAEHIEDGYEKRGVAKDEAEARAWATVNKMTGGGKKSDSGIGKKIDKEPAKKGGRIGGAASAARPKAARKASAKKAAATRKRRVG